MENSAFKISKKIMVKPSTPTLPPHRIHKLSLFDQSFSNMHIPLGFFYPGVDQNGTVLIPDKPEQIFQRLEASLSRTLAFWHPFAGRLIDNTSVNCNDVGIELYEVHVDRPMSEILNIDDKNRSTDAESIAFPKGLPWRNLPENGSLAVAQLTHFACGGIAVSSCVSHKIGDFSSMRDFLRDWAMFNKNPGIDMSEPPQFVEDSFYPPPPSGSPLSAPIIWPEENVHRRFVFSSTKLRELKDLVATKSEVQNPTRTEVLLALLLRCGARAVAAATNSSHTFSPSALVSMANIRSMIAPELPRKSIGNLITYLRMSATSEVEFELPRLVAEMRKEKDKLLNESDRNSMNQILLSFLQETIEISNRIPDKSSGAPIECVLFLSTSILGLPAYDIDFGWGTPRRVAMPNSPVKKGFALMGDESGFGAEAIVSLGENEMQLFEKDGELLEFVEF